MRDIPGYIIVFWGGLGMSGYIGVFKGTSFLKTVTERSQQNNIILKYCIIYLLTFIP
jgi:hypothetical protein